MPAESLPLYAGKPVAKVGVRMEGGRSGRSPLPYPSGVKLRTFEPLPGKDPSKLSYRDVTTRRGLLEVRNAKNSDYDTIKLRPEVRQAIEDFLEVLNRDLQRRETRPEDPVFVSLSKRTFGKRLSAYAINQTVKAHVRDAGIKRRITAHSMRHTVTTHALGAGAPLHQVQRHLRHKDVRTTLRYERDRDVRKNPTLDLLPPVG